MEDADGKVTLNDIGPKLDQERIRAFEFATGINLPTEYFNFLLECNGGVPRTSSIPIPDRTIVETDIQEFLGLDQKLDSSNLEWNLEVFADRLPAEGLLPIARDSSNNLFVLTTIGDAAGRVLYLDLEAKPPKQFVVALSINDLCRKME